MLEEQRSPDGPSLDRPTPLPQNPDCQKFSPSKKIDLDASSSASDVLKLLIACTKHNVDIDGFYFGVAPEEIKGCKNGFPTRTHHSLDRLSFSCHVEPHLHHNETALMWAARNGHEDIVSSLRDSGADINLQDTYGKTALMWAVQYGQDRVFSSMLDFGGDIHIQDTEGNTALILAAYYGHAHILSSLIDIGADINHKTGGGSTALM